MKTLLRVLLVLVVAGVASATDMDRPISSGIIECAAEVGTENPDALPTVSISFLRVDTGEQIFCMDVDATGNVAGPSASITVTSSDVFVESYAWSAAGCAGVVSLASADRYRVVFAAPNRPVLLLAPPNP